MASSKKQFCSEVDMSNPLGFLVTAMKFAASETDLFKKETVLCDLYEEAKKIKNDMEASDNERRQMKLVKHNKESKVMDLEEETKDKIIKDLFKKKSVLEDLYEEARKIKNDMEASDNERRQMELVKHNKESKVIDLEEEETQDKILKAPYNNGYGVDLDDYSWVQSLREVVVIVPLPPGPEAKQVKCRMQNNHLLLGFGDQPPIIDGELYKSITLNGRSFWITEEKYVTIHLVKHDDQMELWKCLVKGDLEIDSQKVEAESSMLLDLDPKGQSTMLKMLLDEQLKSMGLPMPHIVEMFSKSLAEQYPTLLKLAAKKNNHISAVPSHRKHGPCAKM